MSSINVVVLTGYAASDVELYGEGEKKVGVFRLAVDTSYKTGGEWVKRADFHDVKMYGQFAVKRAEKLKKGDYVELKGHLRSESWEKDGKKGVNAFVEVQLGDSLIVTPKADVAKNDEAADATAAE